MIERVTFRQWSILADMGEPGRTLLAARREMREKVRAVQRAVLHDAILHGRGIHHIDMGEGCTPIIRRIDPNDFYIPPQEKGT